VYLCSETSAASLFESTAKFSRHAAFVVSWHSKLQWEHQPPVAEVFNLLQAVQLQVLTVYTSIEKHQLDEVLDDVAAASSAEQNDLMKAVEASAEVGMQEINLSTWRPMMKPLAMCKREIESSHPYASCADVYEHVSFPGASYLVLTFDPKTSTEDGQDYITFFKDSTHSEFWGEPKYSGGMGGSLAYPGVQGSPPLVIPADSFILHFHSDMGKPEWGYKFSVEGPVDETAAQRLKAERHENKPASLKAIQRALRICLNNETAAGQYLAMHAAKLNKQVALAEREDSGLQGAHEDKSRGLQVNLLTAEVYVNQTMLVSLPGELACHPDCKALFGAQSDLYCNVVEKNNNRTWLQMKHRGVPYHVQGWRSLVAHTADQMFADKYAERLHHKKNKAFSTMDPALQVPSAGDTEFLSQQRRVEVLAQVAQLLHRLSEQQGGALPEQQRCDLIRQLADDGFDSWQTLKLVQTQDTCLHSLKSIKVGHARLLVQSIQLLAQSEGKAAFAVQDEVQEWKQKVSEWLGCTVSAVPEEVCDRRTLYGNHWKLGGIDKQFGLNFPRQGREQQVIQFQGFVYKLTVLGEKSFPNWADGLLSSYWATLQGTDSSLHVGRDPIYWVRDLAENNGVDQTGEPFSEMLMYHKGDPQCPWGTSAGCFYEIVQAGEEGFQIFALWDHCRVMQRKQVFVSNYLHAYADLTALADIKHREPPTPGLRHTAGNFFAGVLPKIGTFERSKDWSISEYRTYEVSIRRLRNQLRRVFEADNQRTLHSSITENLADEWRHEEFVPPDSLQGLLPQALLEGFSCWRTGPNVIRGYPFVDEDRFIKLNNMDPEKRAVAIQEQGRQFWQGSSILVLLSDGKAVVYLLPSPDFEHCFDNMQPILPSNTECRVLLNTLAAAAGSPLSQVLTRLSLLELPSHILVWTDSLPQENEQCPISRVDMPRLGSQGLQFTAEGDRLWSVNYSGWFISDKIQQSDSEHLKGRIQFALWLENEVGQLSLLVAGFQLAKMSYFTSPLSATHAPVPPWASELTGSSQGFKSGNPLFTGLPVCMKKKLRTPVYRFDVHLSKVYLQAADLESKLYLAYVRMVTLDFDSCFSTLTTCFSDTPFSEQETLWLTMITNAGNGHVDAFGCKLVVALMFYDGGQKPTFDVRYVYREYLQHLDQIASSCRLSQADEKLSK
jgi:hypothetical protein